MFLKVRPLSGQENELTNFFCTNSTEQVDEIHNQHRSKIETLRGSSKAKASSFVKNKMQMAKSAARQQKSIEEIGGDSLARALGMN